MTINEIFGETQNHMYTALKMRYLNNKVRTGERDSNGTIIGAAVGEVQGAVGKITDLGAGLINKGKEKVKDLLGF